MSEDLRHLLHEEMASQLRPPTDGLVASAVQRGRHRRRVRTAASAVGTTAVVGITVLAVAGGGVLSSGRSAGSAGVQAGTTAAQTVAAVSTTIAPAVPWAAPATSAAATSAAPVTSAAASAAAPVEGSADDKAAAGATWRALQDAASAAHPPHWTAGPSGVPATPQGELQLFTELAKPYGVVSDPGVSEDSDKTHVRANVTTPDGKVGQVQFSLEHDTLGYDADCLPKPASYLAKFAHDGPSVVTCHHTQDGGYVVESTFQGGCLNAADVLVVHPDGTAVDVSVGSCWTDFGNGMHSGAQPLTAAQAESIFQDAGFDFTMPADVVTAGAALGTLRTFH